MFLLRLSPLVPFNILNYALALSGVRYPDFAIALLGMIPAIVMYTYYGKVVGDVAALAAGVAPPRGPEYYALLIVGSDRHHRLDDDDHARGAPRRRAAAESINHSTRSPAARSSCAGHCAHVFRSIQRGAQRRRPCRLPTRAPGSRAQSSRAGGVSVMRQA